MFCRLGWEQLEGQALSARVCLDEWIAVDARDDFIHPIAHFDGIHLVESAARKNDDDTFAQVGHVVLQSVRVGVDVPKAASREPTISAPLIRPQPQKQEVTFARPPDKTSITIQRTWDGLPAGDPDSEAE
jgi:hypothetical protein